jgi:hypothetical protein
MFNQANRCKNHHVNEILISIMPRLFITLKGFSEFLNCFDEIRLNQPDIFSLQKTTPECTY